MASCIAWAQRRLDEYRKYVEKDAALERRFQKVLVDQPSVEDTIAILRGLKEKYEVHHGVDITDPALVAAASLSYRYISDRQLPDKAIDLIDEAASRIRMEMDSKPEEMDKLYRRLIQLKIEQVALKKEADAASKKRLEACWKQTSPNWKKNTPIWKKSGRRKKRRCRIPLPLKKSWNTRGTELETARRGNDLAKHVGIAIWHYPCTWKSNCKTADTRR